MPLSAVAATLIVDPRSMRLSDALIAHLAQAVGRLESQRWLDEGVAADFLFSAPLDAVRAALRQALAGEPVDVIVQPTAHRAKRLLVADMDSTLISQEGVDELAALASATASPPSPSGRCAARSRSSRHCASACPCSPACRKA